MSELVLQSSGNLITPERLEYAFDRYLQTDVGEGDASSDTLKTYRGNIKQFLAWCDRQLLHPLAATRRQLKEFRLWLLETQQYKRATVALKLSVVRRFYDALIENELMSFNPALGLKPPREAIDPAVKINYLESAEMRSLIENLPQDDTPASLRDRLLVAMMVIQGVRTIEMYRVSVGDIVKRGKDVGLKVSGKRSIRIVPLTPDLAALLRQYLMARKKAGEKLTEDTPLFVSYSRNCDVSSRLSRRSMQRIVDKYLIANGLKESTVKARKQGRRGRRFAARHETRSVPEGFACVAVLSAVAGGRTDIQSACGFPRHDVLSQEVIVPKRQRGAMAKGKEVQGTSNCSALEVGRQSLRSTEGNDDRSLEPPAKRPLPQRRLSAHSLRHTAGTLALRAGASLRQVQDLLGHADPRTTALYAHIADRWQFNPALWLDVPTLRASSANDQT